MTERDWKQEDNEGRKLRWKDNEPPKEKEKGKTKDSTKNISEKDDRLK